MSRAVLPGCCLSLRCHKKKGSSSINAGTASNSMSVPVKATYVVALLFGGSSPYFDREERVRLADSQPSAYSLICCDCCEPSGWVQTKSTISLLMVNNLRAQIPQKQKPAKIHFEVRQRVAARRLKLKKGNVFKRQLFFRPFFRREDEQTKNRKL